MRDLVADALAGGHRVVGAAPGAAGPMPGAGGAGVVPPAAGAPLQEAAGPGIQVAIALSDDESDDEIDLLSDDEREDVLLRMDGAPL